MIFSANSGFTVHVAPFAGAWIEIPISLRRKRKLVKSLPSRERGLKLLNLKWLMKHGMSLPSRERGLKYYYILYIVFHTTSLPSRERGLKLM